MSWSQNHIKPNTSSFTPQKIQYQPTQHHEEQTAIKNPPENRGVQKDYLKTPGGNSEAQRKGLIFIGSNRSKHLFPLYIDEEIGIKGELQLKVHHTTHDDDKMTTTTQLGLAISQTC